MTSRCVRCGKQYQTQVEGQDRQGLCESCVQTAALSAARPAEGPIDLAGQTVEADVGQTNPTAFSVPSAVSSSPPPPPPPPPKRSVLEEWSIGPIPNYTPGRATAQAPPATRRKEPDHLDSVVWKIIGPPDITLYAFVLVPLALILCVAFRQAVDKQTLEMVGAGGAAIGFVILVVSGIEWYVRAFRSGLGFLGFVVILLVPLVGQIYYLFFLVLHWSDLWPAFARQLRGGFIMGFSVAVLRLSGGHF